MNRLDVVPEPQPQIRLVREDGSPLVLHPLWLRERCTAPESMDRATGQRLYNPSDLDPALSLTDVLQAGPNEIVVRFSDGHVSHFAPADILAEADRTPRQNGLPQPVAWTSTLAALPRHAWSEAPDLMAMAGDFLRYGFVILSGVPSRDGALLEVARAFGFPRETNFGTVFDVRSLPNANDLAYTSVPLAPHMDNPYRDPVPGIQLLHCLTNRTSGGLSTLVDGLAVAEMLRRDAPEAFRLLTTTPVRFVFRDKDAEHIRWAPPIELGVDGAVDGINFSPRLDFAALADSEALEAFYRARRLFDRALCSADYEIRFRLDDGDLVMFANRRTLHGRTHFDPNEGLRHLQGCYIDMDGPRSLYRVLARKTGA